MRRPVAAVESSRAGIGFNLREFSCVAEVRNYFQRAETLYLSKLPEPNKERSPQR